MTRSGVATFHTNSHQARCVHPRPVKGAAGPSTRAEVSVTVWMGRRRDRLVGVGGAPSRAYAPRITARVHHNTSASLGHVAAAVPN